MSIPAHATVRNRLLSLMKVQDFDLLAPHMEWMKLGKGVVLTEPDTPIEHVYFLESGVVSMVAVSPEGLEVEAGIFGREGMGPPDLMMGANTSANRVLIQVEDDAWRIAKAPFLAAVDASPTLRALLLRFVRTLLVQTSYTALSNAVHRIDERLARWILMCDDRVEGADLWLTHEFMSVMLAVRRPSVTTALHVLEGNGFIRTGRGCVIIRDRAALERFAGDAYGRPEAAYREQIGPMN